MRGRGSSEEWKSAKPRGSERWKKRTHGLSVWWPTRRCRFTSSKRSTQKSGEPVCKTTGCEDECARWSGESGSGLSGAGTLEIELLSQRAIEPGEPAHPQGSARDSRVFVLPYPQQLTVYAKYPLPFFRRFRSSLFALCCCAVM